MKKRGFKFRKLLMLEKASILFDLLAPSPIQQPLLGKPEQTPSLKLELMTEGFGGEVATLCLKMLTVSSPTRGGLCLFHRLKD